MVRSKTTISRAHRFLIGSTQAVLAVAILAVVGACSPATGGRHMGDEPWFHKGIDWPIKSIVISSNNRQRLLVHSTLHAEGPTRSRVQVFDVSSGLTLWSKRFFVDPNRNFAVSPDGRYVVIDNKIYSGGTGIWLANLSSYQNCFVQGGRRIVGSAWKSQLFIYDASVFPPKLERTIQCPELKDIGLSQLSCDFEYL